MDGKRKRRLPLFVSAWRAAENIKGDGKTVPKASCSVLTGMHLFYCPSGQ